jgi:FkbM family methyltransferase
VFFDIGANAGYFSLVASRLVGPTGTVVAFEPLPMNLAYLHEHLRLNNVSNVQVVPAAVCEEDGEAVFDAAPGPLGARLAATGGSKVRTLAIDSVVARGELPSPDFVKIDAEGAELRILTGARSVLQSAAPVLFIDTHSGVLQRECCDFLLDLGYALHAIDGLELTRSRELLCSMR